ncbi:hypothetical protein [Crateriforma spongiae]|uniref:hypothetical protein n=1 Tax=Crateriforma spongiae TaxID=2724528 RepID=UPI0039AF8DEE
MRHFMVCLLLAAFANEGSNNAGAEPPDPPSTSPTGASKRIPAQVTATVSPNHRVMIHVDDIGRRIGEKNSVTLVGRLGEPLATKLQLSGRWQMSPRPPRTVYPMHPSVKFVVFEVNGSQLPKSVEFDAAQVKAEFLKWPTDDQTAVPIRTNAIPSKPESIDGEEWTMTAYETGRFIAVPSERGDRKVFSLVYALDYNQFRSHIIGVVTSIDGEPCDEPKSR